MFNRRYILIPKRRMCVMSSNNELSVTTPAFWDLNDAAEPLLHGSLSQASAYMAFGRPPKLIAYGAASAVPGLANT